MIKLKRVNIKKFRKLQDIQIPIGNKLTVIAGQNGTMKSSILGLIGGPFDFEKKVNEKHRTIANKPFNKRLEDAFVWAYPEFENAGDHSYEVEVDTGNGVSTYPVKSFKRSDSPKLRFVVGKTRKEGDGHILLPVIHLSLSRLFPLSDIDSGNIEISPISDLTAQEVQLYNKWYNEILLLSDTLVPEYLISPTKTYLGAKTAIHDTRGFSSGQDNIGQIITAILSFARLKAKLGLEYPGGILLLDEVESTLYPAAQEKLTTYLYKFARDYNLQIVVTTHSLEVLKTAMNLKYQNDTEIIFLSASRGKLKRIEDFTYEKLENHMCVKTSEKPEVRKLMVLCEDDTAKLFIKSLLGTKILRQVEVVHGKSGLSNAFLISLAEASLTKFADVIYVVDGDTPPKLKFNVISLPGNAAPERILYNYLSSLPEDSTFWDDEGGYTKQVCFKTYRPLKLTDIEEIKKWFSEQVPYWGRSCSKVLNHWKSSDDTIRESFVVNFKTVYDKVSFVPLDIE